MRTRQPVRPGGRATDARSELLYGRNAVRESLVSGRRSARRILFAEGLERDARINEIEQLARQRGAQVLSVARADLDARCTGHHQGVALEAAGYPYADPPDLVALASSGTTILALDSVVDPRNVGALLRTADAAGFQHIVVPYDRAAGITPAVVHASAGAAEHLHVWREVNLVRWLVRAKSAGLWVAGLAVDSAAQPLFDVDLPPPLVLVIGAEGAGLRRLTREACDLLVEIPMFGRVDSLNAAVAGALAMYEVRRWLENGADPDVTLGG